MNGWREPLRRYVRELPPGYSVHVVIDASLALMWLTDEPDAALARRYAEGALAGDVGLTVPSLFWYEVARVLGGLDPPRPDAWRALLGVPIATVELDADAFPEVEALARRHGIPPPAAAYVFLARALHVPLITADESLAERCRDLRLVWPLSLLR